MKMTMRLVIAAALLISGGFLQAGTLTVIYSFGLTGGEDGLDPASALIQGSDGSFYGTTSGGGAYGKGTVFKIAIYPTNRDQCRNEGWANFIKPVFRNEGKCIQFFNTGKS